MGLLAPCGAGVRACTILGGVALSVTWGQPLIEAIRCRWPHVCSSHERQSDPASASSGAVCGRGGAALDEAIGCDPAYVAACERRRLVVELHRQVERMKALEPRLLNSCDDLAMDEGARSVSDWFAHHTRSDRQPVARDAALAEALEVRCPLLSESVHTGAVEPTTPRTASSASPTATCATGGERRWRGGVLECRG